MTERPEKWITFVRDELLPVLKSGEYKQGHGALRTEFNGETSYCCLGVVCDMLIKRGGLELEWRQLRDVSLDRIPVQPIGVTPIVDVTWYSFLPDHITRELEVDPNPFMFTLEPPNAWSREWEVVHTNLASLNDDDRSGTFELVIKVLECALDPDNKEWFFDGTEAQKVADQFNYEGRKHADGFTYYPVRVLI